MSCGISNAIAKLAELVVNTHEASWLGRQLEKQGYLSYKVLQEIRGDPSQSWHPDLEDAIFRFYAQASPFRATMDIAHSEGMAAIVNQLLEEKGHSEKVEPHEDLSVLVERVLYLLTVPFYKKPAGPQGLNSTLTVLQEVQKALLDVKKRQAKDLYALQGFTMTGWASVERLLEITIRFYVRHFSATSIVADQLQNSFKKAIERKSLGPVLHGFTAVESIFKVGETERKRGERDKQRKKRLKEAERETTDQIFALQEKARRYAILERPQADIDGIEEQIHRLEQSLRTTKERERDEEERILSEKRSLASLLQDEFRGDFGSDSPFEGFVGIKERGSIPAGYRNDYAHLTFAEVYEKHGLKGALASVEKALSLVTELKGIAPETVLLVGIGQDCYGRELIYFIDEGAIAEDGQILLRQVEAMYKEHSFYIPFATCLMFAREGDGNICSPIIYYLDDVM